jgi:hypothetical protein
MSPAAVRSTWLWLLLLLAACPRPPATLQVLYLSPDHGQVAQGDSVRFAASGLYSDGTTKLMTAQVAWLVDDVLVASTDRSSPGKVDGVAPGTTVVRARYDGVSASRPLTVTESTLRLLQVYPPRPVAPLGLPVQLQAIAVHTDQTIENVTGSAVWMPADPSLFSATGGRLLGKAPGTADLAVSWKGGITHVQVTVTAASVVRLDVQPGVVTLPVGFGQQLTATATLTDDSTLDLTAASAWQSTAPGTAFVNTGATSPGLVTGQAVGDATVSATSGSVSAQAVVHVTAAVLTAVVVAPAQATLAKGTAVDLFATGLFSDGSSRDVTAQATWTVSAPAVAETVPATPGRIRGLAVGTARVTAALFGKSGSADLTVSAATLQRLEVAPASRALARGTVGLFSATGTFTDGTTQDLTTQVVWTVADPAMASVSNAPGSRGETLALALGATTVVAELGTLSGHAALTVTAAVLRTLQVMPPSPQVPMGTTQPLTATGVFSDASTQDLTAQATWTSSAPAVARVSNAAGTRGLVDGKTLGVSTVSASLSGILGAAEVTVTAGVLQSLSLAPAPLTVARGARASLSAMGVYSDNSLRALTAQVTWSSSDPRVATVSTASGHEGEIEGVAVGAVDVRAQLGQVWATVRVTVTAAVLTAIEVSPATPHLAAGLSVAFSALGTWSDSTTSDVTSQALWSSSVQPVASVSNAAGAEGLASAASAGATLISATLSGVTGSATLTVTPALLTALSVSPPALTLTRGSSARFAVRGSYSDGTSIDLTTQVTWDSSPSTVATASNVQGSQGTVVARGVGEALITASLGGVTGQATLTVSPALLERIDVDPPTASRSLGTSLDLAATGRYSDGTTQVLTDQVAWSSSDEVVATVSNTPGSAGRVSALHQGTATITARVGLLHGAATFTVTVASLESITVSPAAPHLAPGTGLALGATGRWTDGSTQDLTTQVTWGSSDGAVAQVSNVGATRGRLTANAPGTATISAVFDGVTGSTVATVSAASLTALALTPPAPGAPIGQSVALTATGTFSDGSSQDLTSLAGWNSSDPSRASVVGGAVTAVAVGSADISATVLGRTATVTFSASAAVLTAVDVNPVTATVPVGGTQGFTASGTFSDGSNADVTALATWTSGDLQVASTSNVPGSRGVATGAAVGQTTITASLGGRSAQATLTVSPAALVSLAVTPLGLTLPLGRSQAFTATGTYSDGRTRDLTALATWSSDASGVATISNAAGEHGVATSQGVGVAQLSAAVGGLSDGVTLTVTAAELSSLGITPASPVIPKGLTAQLRVSGVYTDGTTRDLTEDAAWLSSDQARAPVSGAAGTRGLVSGLLQGTATLSASVGGLTASVTVTVSAASLLSLQVTPQPASTPAGTTVQLTATGLYSDTTALPLTQAVTWASDAPGVAAVSNSSGSEGRVSGVTAGTATVTASLGGVQGATVVTVTPAALVAVQVTPANTSLAKGWRQPFTATGVYTDGSRRDVTATVTWDTSDHAVAVVSNAAGDRGTGTALQVGSTSVTALDTATGKTGSTTFSVTSKVLTDLKLTPASASVPLGSVRQLVATGTYSDLSTSNLTTQASWASSDPAVVSVSNAVGSKGLASTLATGAVTLTTSAGGFTATTTMTVSQAALASIDISPAAGQTALGYTRQFIAIGSFTDGTTQVLTTQATWASSNPLTAFISNAVGSKGLLTPVAQGTITVSATWSGVTGSTSHAVSPAQLLGVTVTPASATLARDASLQLTATGSFSDGSTQDLTLAVLWDDALSGVAQVSNAADSAGLVTAGHTATGPVTITATSGGHTGTAHLTVQ